MGLGKELSRYLVWHIKPQLKIYSSILAFSLLFGAFLLLFMPLEVKAGFFSSILGDEVYADTRIVEDIQSNKNSQTMALLQANVSSASIFQDKSDPKGSRQGGTNGAGKNNSEASIIDPNANINILSDNALLPATSPLGVSVGVYDGTGSGDFSFDQVNVYVVRSGDTVGEVADMFGVTVDTILSANDMKKGDKLKEGDVLLILPFSGIEHTIIKGQTLQSIANLYKADVDEILLANDIDVDAKLVIGEKLMIPGADMLSETKPKSGSETVAKRSGLFSLMPSIIGYFKNPVPNGRKSQGITSRHRGVDIAAPIGTPIYATASGRILTAKMGWNGAYGNMVILQHPNGTRTLYAHMSKLNTTTGAQVSQGQVIGYVGSTGRSTGSHLHFEVLGAKNPF